MFALLQKFATGLSSSVLTCDWIPLLFSLIWHGVCLCNLFVVCLILQWVKILRVTDVYHFHDMIEMLVGCGYKKGTTLFGYGYDFRQSNRYLMSTSGSFISYKY